MKNQIDVQKLTLLYEFIMTAFKNYGVKMKRVLSVFLCSVLSVLMFSSCGVSNKQIIRMQKLEEGVDSPTSIEELRDAIEKYQNRVKDIQLAQTQTGIWYKILGTRYLDNRMYGEALKCFQAALQYHPTNQNLYYYVGICAGYMSHASLDFDATGNADKKMNYLKLSESAYLRAIELEPRYTRALYALSVLYVYELDENEKAIPYLEKLLSIDTKNVDAMFVLARALYCTQEFDRAVDMYDKIISITKSSEKKADAENNKKIVLDASYARE